MPLSNEPLPELDPFDLSSVLEEKMDCGHNIQLPETPEELYIPPTLDDIDPIINMMKCMNTLEISTQTADVVRAQAVTTTDQTTQTNRLDLTMATGLPRARQKLTCMVEGKQRLPEKNDEPETEDPNVIIID